MRDTIVVPLPVSLHRGEAGPPEKSTTWPFSSLFGTFRRFSQITHRALRIVRNLNSMTV